MKLSEAISMNGMMKRQGFGCMSMDDVERPCAIGGALQSIGKQNERWYALEREWPFVLQHKVCPACLSGAWISNPGVAYHNSQTIELILWHLNDAHRWTRQQIAEWVASIEPQEEQAEISGQGPRVATLEVSAL